MTTVPDPRRLGAALAYARRGWHVFVLGRDKTTLSNCDRCAPGRGYDGHDRQTCECLTCHGFYAATLDHDRIGEMLQRHDGMLAVRTGRVSRLLAVDAESTLDTHAGVTGLDVLDQWESWTNGEAGELQPTLRQRTGGGGMHLLYELPPSSPVTSGRILPMIDVKADGGYVAVPDGTGEGGAGADGRRWLNWPEWRHEVAEVSPALVTWLTGRRRLGGRSGALRGGGGGGEGAPAGYSFREVNRLQRIPDGVREVYTRDLSYSLFRAGHSEDEVLEIMRRRWLTYDQPGVGGGARWYMPWEHVVAKVRRDRYTVEAEPPLASALTGWVSRLDVVSAGSVNVSGENVSEVGEVGTETRRVGNVTLVRRQRDK